jgi:tRNA threonylcarbamoyladenosine biosynthesis protein TsaE
MKKVRISRSPDETEALAGLLWKQCRPKGIRAFLLEGPLGAGKTVFVRGLAKAMGVRRPVKSPSFTIASEYPGPRGNLLHMDFYRLKTPGDLESTGLESWRQDPELCLAVEWPDRFWGPFRSKPPFPPGQALWICFRTGSNSNSRRFDLVYL